MTVVKLSGPLEKFETIIRILRFSATICGIDLLEDNYRMNWITYTLFSSITAYYGFLIFTICNNYGDDWTIILRVSVTLGTSFQGVSKLYAFISNKELIFNMHRVLHDIYKDYEKMADIYTEALHNSLRKTKNGMYSLMLFYGVGYMGMIAMPFLWLFVTGERVLVIEFHIPGLDLSTDFGYFITVGFQMVLIVCFAFGLYCGDLVALVYLMQSFMFSYIFAAKVECVNQMIADPSGNSKPCVTMALKDIVQWHQLFSEFTENCNGLFYYVITVQIITAFCSTVLSVYLIMIGAWPGAYTYFIISVCCLYLYCILGTENEMANSQFENHIYSIHWYNMTVSQQKLVLQILYKTQHPSIIDVAGVMPLSVSTALHITKTVYSITMFMFQFFVE